MRTYEPIWISLKKEGRCTITAPPQLHKRIIKAVIKEKNEDVVFKIYLGENCQKAKLSYSRSATNKSVLTFTLRRTIGLEEI